MYKVVYCFKGMHLIKLFYFKKSIIVKNRLYNYLLSLSQNVILISLIISTVLYII